jgi:hypothetical protein
MIGLLVTSHPDLDDNSASIRFIDHLIMVVGKVT